MNVKAEDLVHGCWPEVLQAAGMHQSFFKRGHGPCPFCPEGGGQDRYRWSEKHGGVWVCSVCTGSVYATGFQMLMRHMGYQDFRQAADHVREHFKVDGKPKSVRRMPSATQRKAEDQEQRERNLDRMHRIWDASRAIESGDAVDLYLSRRVPGLDAKKLAQIRIHPALDYWQAPEDPKGKPLLLGRFPAMVARAFDPTGAFVQLHKTYLTADGNKAAVPVVKKTERGVGVNGFAVPLIRFHGNTLGVSEGLETACAAMMLKHIPVWSCLNGPSMAAFDLPASLVDQIERVVIFADNDPLQKYLTGEGARYRSPGSHYAEQLAERVRNRGKRVLVVKAARVGDDMVNQWMEAAGNAVAV